MGEISEEISSTPVLEPEPHHRSVIRHRTSRPTGYRKSPTLNPLDPPEFANLPIPSTIQPYILLTSPLLALVVRSLTFTVRFSLTRRRTRHLRSRPLPNPCTRAEELACFSRNSRVTFSEKPTDSCSFSRLIIWEANAFNSRRLRGSR